jgi:transcriptional regulator with XRE-family HTH domain
MSNRPTVPPGAAPLQVSNIDASIDHVMEDRNEKHPHTRTRESLKMADAYLDVDALYGALDATRKEKELSWRDIAKEAGVSASTLTRMAQGKRPDVDGFASLVAWLGVPADYFIRRTDQGSKRTASPMAMISTYLRADKHLDKKSAEALEDIIQVAWRTLKP